MEEKYVKEAKRRLKAMGYESYIDTIFRHENYFALAYHPHQEHKYPNAEYIKEIVAEECVLRKVMPYLVVAKDTIATSSRAYRSLYVLFVSKDKENWKDESYLCETKGGLYTYALVINLDVPEYTEVGLVNVDYIMNA